MLSYCRVLRDGVVGFSSLKRFADTEYDTQALGKSKFGFGSDELYERLASAWRKKGVDEPDQIHLELFFVQNDQAAQYCISLTGQGEKEYDNIMDVGIFELICARMISKRRDHGYCTKFHQ